jgi:hypothetical protein
LLDLVCGADGLGGVQIEPTYKVTIGDQHLTVEATTWRKDLDTGEVVFVIRHRLPDGEPTEHEVSRHQSPHPHRHIRRR